MGDTLLEKQLEIQKEIMGTEEEKQDVQQPDKKRIKVSDKQLFVLKNDMNVNDDEGSD